jgi:hypothetical protein
VLLYEYRARAIRGEDDQSLLLTMTQFLAGMIDETGDVGGEKFMSEFLNLV